MSRRSSRLSLIKYLQYRLGNRPGPALFNLFIKPFLATSFAEFWNYWNPVYGYVLYRYSYRPLRWCIPRTPAVLLTFAAPGFFLHDIPAWILTRSVHLSGATVCFILLGFGVIIGEAARMDLSS